MNGFALKHPIITGFAVWIGATLAAFGFGVLWINYFVIPELAAAQNGNVPSDVGGMGALAAFGAVAFASVIVGFMVGLTGLIVLFKQRTKQKP